MSDCLFCKIIAGDIPSHRVWEGEKHLAFLTIFPNTEGVTVVVPKEHYESYAFALPDEVLSELVLATKEVARRLDAALPDVGRSAMVFEGFGVDHMHAKLYPMHGTKNMREWRPIESKRTEFYTVYPGYVSSHDAARADDAELEMLAKRLRGEA